MSNLPIAGLIAPVLVLNAWTFIMEFWMYAVNIPVMNRLNIQNTITKSQLDAQLPPSTRWKKDNYNHLMEQPTQFYAIALSLAIIRGFEADEGDVFLAWAYVGFRIAHSLVHSTSNLLMTRFTLFALSSAVLAGMTVRGMMVVWGN